LYEALTTITTTTAATTTQVSGAAFVIHIHNKILGSLLRGGHAMFYVVRWEDSIPERQQGFTLLTLNNCIKCREILQKISCLLGP